MSRDIIYLVIGSSHGRMAQLVVPTGTFSRMRDVDVNRLLASRSLESTEGSPKNPNILGEIVRIVRIRSHGSVGRTSCPVQPTFRPLSPPSGVEFGRGDENRHRRLLA